MEKQNCLGHCQWFCLPLWSSVQCIKTAFVNLYVWHHCSVIGYFSISISIRTVSEYSDQCVWLAAVRGQPILLESFLHRRPACPYTLAHTHIEKHMLYIHTAPTHTPWFLIKVIFFYFCHPFHERYSVHTLPQLWHHTANHLHYGWCSR